MTSRFRKWALSSPPAEWALNQLRELLIGSVRQGPVPQHIAFVMDGNRRYARQNRIETVEGHNLGFEALAKVLEVCFKAGVKVVTIYAFSIENFKRSKHEVDGLMDMAKIKLSQLSQHGDLLDRYGAKVRILGERDLLQPDVLQVMDRVVEMTSGNGESVLNICFPYTSREEITAAVRDTVKEYSTPIAQPSPEKDRHSAFKEERIANTIRSQHLTEQTHSKTHLSPVLQQKSLSPSSSTTSLSTLSTPTETFTDHENEHDTSSLSSTTTLQSPSLKPINISSSSPIYPSPELITPSTISNHMYTSSDPPLDLLIRTSGVERLSDFMLWQCHQDTHIVFLDILWPQFDLWGFLPVLWEWQWRVRKERSSAVVEEAREEKERARSRSRSKTGSTTTATKASGTRRVKVT